MSRIEEEYKTAVNTPSDINQHLEFLYEQSSPSNVYHITEMGIRTGVSTRAFLAAGPLQYKGYDIKQPPAIVIDLISEVCGEYGEFILGDSLEVDIEHTDILFIDTLHNGDQLYRELTRHEDKVDQKIILHDTSTFGYKDEQYEGPYAYVGLVPAIMAFLSKNPQWVLKRVFTHNNGLSVLERVTGPS
jgi:hypothetical protein